MKKREDFLNKIREVEEKSVFKFINLNNYRYDFASDNSMHLTSLDAHYKLISEKCYAQFLQRLGLNCPVFQDQTFLGYNKNSVADMVNRVLLEGPEVYTKAYCREGDILACHSKDYKPLDISALFETLEDTLLSEYQNVEFFNGYYSDDFTIVDFAIKDKRVTAAYEKFLSNDQRFFESKIIVRLVTSNLGMSGANLYPMFIYKTSKDSPDKLLPMTDKRICLEHKGAASVEKFRQNCEQIFPLVEMLPNELSVLDKITIEYPTHCVINLAEKTGIPAKRIKDIAENVSFIFDGCKPNAKELYKIFVEVIDKGDSDVEKMQLAEKVAKALRILKNHKDDVDIPKTKWKRLAVTANEDQEFIPDDIDFGPQMSFEGVA